jgi:hypothetical protein
VSQAFQRKFARLVERRGEQVVARWNAVTGGVNPVTKEPNGSSVPGTTTLQALDHTPDYATGRVQRFTEIPVGAIILDFPGGTLAALIPPEGTVFHDMTFTVAGVEYVPHQVGDQLVKSWDARIGGTEIAATVVLKLKV